MKKCRAVIAGCGRIGTGWNWAKTSFTYTHKDCYAALFERVELVAVCDPIEERRRAVDVRNISYYENFDTMIERERPDIVSLCTQPEGRAVLIEKCIKAGVRGIFCEKPYNSKLLPPQGVKIQVHLWRRFDSPHQRIAANIESGRYGKVLGMTVAGKRDEATVCHLTDLALWWRVPRGNFHYCDVTTGGYVELSYDLYCEKAVVRCQEGGMLLFTYEAPIRSRWFPGHDIMRGNAFDQRLTKPCFMETALGNLLDAIEGKAALLSPPEAAVKAEAWADDILKGNA